MNIPPFSENALALFFIQSTILQLLAGWGYIFQPKYHPSLLRLLPWDIPFCVYPMAWKYRTGGIARMLPEHTTSYRPCCQKRNPDTYHFVYYYPRRVFSPNRFDCVCRTDAGNRKIPINNAVIIRSRVGDTAHDNASQISVANKAPAVPGANGEKPEPKPVAIIIWISGTLFILSVKCVQSYKNNITFPLVREKVISRIPSAWNFSFIGMEQKFR